jgi:hypothetical protein
MNKIRINENGFISNNGLKNKIKKKQFLKTTTLKEQGEKYS